MPEPEQDWVGRAIPAAPDWVVRPRWYGLFTLESYDSPERCFAANRTCRQDLVREAIARHYHPGTHIDPGPVRVDRDAGHSTRDGGHADTSTDRDVDAPGGDATGGAGDGNGDGNAHHLRADDRDAGGAQDVLLGGRAALTDADADVSPVRDAGARNAVSEGGVDKWGICPVVKDDPWLPYHHWGHPTDDGWQHCILCGAMQFTDEVSDG